MGSGITISNTSEGAELCRGWSGLESCNQKLDTRCRILDFRGNLIAQPALGRTIRVDSLWFATICFRSPDALALAC